MANGSSNAKSRLDLINARKARRATLRRRLIGWGWVVAAGLPVVHETTFESAAQEGPIATPASSGQTAEHKATIVPPVARAIAVGQPNQQGDVVQTSGGLLSNVFGGGSSATKSSKEKEDGRKAYPLPPPDPSTVNWSGVPYHTPKPGSIAATVNNADQPIRDSKTGTYASTKPAPTTTARPATTSTTASRPQPLPTNTLPSVSSPPTVSGSVDSPRIANVAPLPPTRSQATTRQADFSTSSSSRRTDRRQIDPLSPDELRTTESGSQANNAPAVPTFSAVERREIADETAAGDQSVDKPATASIAAGAPPTVARKTATAVPPSLAAPATTPSPVSRTQPLSPAVDAKPYPAETIASQLSPLRPVESAAEETLADQSADDPAMPASESIFAEIEGDAWKKAERGAADEQFYGSGVAEPIQRQVTPTANSIVQSRPQTSSGSMGTMIDSANRSAPQPILVPGKMVVTSEIPGIRVITEGPSEILIRELTQYEVRVENRGSIDATGVIVRTALPPWAEVTSHSVSVGSITPIGEESDGQVEWIIDSLPAGVVERLFVRIRAVKPGAFDVATNWTSLPQTHSATITVREPKLSIEIEGPDEIIHGKTQKYRVRVMNPGDGMASNVMFTLAPDADDAMEQPIGNIPAGKEVSFEIELTARDQGELKIQGTASGDLDLSARADKSVAVASAKIDATLTGPPLKYQGTDAVYQLLVTNSGRAISESIAAEVRIPAGVEYLGGIESARVQGDRLIWNVKSLSPGESLNYELNCRMAQTGNHRLTFNCNGTAAGRATVGLETVVEAIADLKLAVFDPPAPAAVGAEVTYEIVIDNRGSKAAENVRIVAQFGHGIEPLRIVGHAGDVVTGQVLFAPIERIEPASQVRMKIVAKADKPGDHRFRAEVRSGETVLVAEEATVYVPVRNERISRSSNDPATR